jgi:hypothetical protein
MVRYVATWVNMGHYGASYRQFILPTKKATKLNVGQQFSNKNSDKIGKWATNKRKDFL